jgi:hypothetical protein
MSYTQFRRKLQRYCADNHRRVASPNEMKRWYTYRRLFATWNELITVLIAYDTATDDDPKAGRVIARLCAACSGEDHFSLDTFVELLQGFVPDIQERDYEFKALRKAIAGRIDGPPLSLIATMLGPRELVRRLRERGTTR